MHSLPARTEPVQMSWNATADIGNVAAAVIAGGPEKWAGKRVGVNGDELDLQQVADTFSRVFGKKVRGIRAKLRWLGSAPGRLARGCLQRAKQDFSTLVSLPKCSLPRLRGVKPAG
jgi:uncharacterized protein YbjT (DUF2867 family)